MNKKINCLAIIPIFGTVILFFCLDCILNMYENNKKTGKHINTASNIYICITATSFPLAFNNKIPNCIRIEYNTLEKII